MSVYELFLGNSGRGAFLTSVVHLHAAWHYDFHEFHYWSYRFLPCIARYLPQSTHQIFEKLWRRRIINGRRNSVQMTNWKPGPLLFFFSFCKFVWHLFWFCLYWCSNVKFQRVIPKTELTFWCGQTCGFPYIWFYSRSVHLELWCPVKFGITGPGAALCSLFPVIMYYIIMINWM